MASISSESAGGSGAAYRSRLSVWRPSLLIIAVGTVLSLLAFKITGESDEVRVRGILERHAEWRARDFEHKIILAAEDVGSIAAYLTVEPGLDIAQFHRFAHIRHGSHNSVSAIIWAPRVKGAERDAFVAAARRNGLPGFDILDGLEDGRYQPAPLRSEYLPKLIEENYDSVPSPAGVDVMMFADRWSRAERARDDGRPIATPPVDVYGGPGPRLGFMVFWPVYAGLGIPETQDERRSRFRGMAIGRFRFDQLLPAVIAGTPKIIESIDVWIDRGGDADTPRRVAHFDPASGAFAIGAAAGGLVEDGGVRLTREFMIQGRRWTLQSRFAPAIVTPLRSGAPFAWLFLGLLLTGTVGGVVQRAHARRLNTEAVVTARTAELREANRSLGEEVDDRCNAEARLRRSERDLRQWADAFENAAIGIAIADPETDRIRICNPAFAKMHGLTVDAVYRRPIAEMCAMVERCRLPGLLAESDRVGRAAIETLQLRTDGSSFPALLDVASVRNVAGEPLYRIVTALDITERRRVRQALYQAQKMEAIGNLTGGMAHDFNNLLGIIIGNLDIVAPRVAADPDLHELVDECFQAAWRGADLTRRLLAFSRRQPLAPKRLELDELIAGMVKLMRRVLGEDIEISLDLASDLWPVVADPAQLEASIANLATNARDAMPRGGRLMIATANRQLDIEYAAAHAEVAPGDYAVIEVSDTGMGMSPEVMNHVFEPFFTTKALGKGTGLGLSMVFGFMKQSGGHVTVDSVPGAGTTFRLYLPRAGDDAVAAAAAAPPALQPGAGETVLVAEDSRPLRRVVVRQLKSLGYRTVEAESAPAALSLLEGGQIDLVFTDIVMPGPVDGFGLAQQILVRWPHIKVVVTSGFAEQKLAGDLRPMGASPRLLSKPYSKAALARLLREVLDQA